MFVMDLHAHLSNYEIIGMLGGTFDAASKRIQARPWPRWGQHEGRPPLAAQQRLWRGKRSRVKCPMGAAVKCMCT